MRAAAYETIAKPLQGPPRVHPETGRKGLFVNPTFTMHVKDVPETQSDTLFRPASRAHDHSVVRRAAPPEAGNARLLGQPRRCTSGSMTTKVNAGPYIGSRCAVTSPLVRQKSSGRQAHPSRRTTRSLDVIGTGRPPMQTRGVACALLLGGYGATCRRRS